MPDCLRISASMAITNGIALKFRATAHGAKNAPLAWRKHLVAMKDLDPAVRQTADNITARAEEVRLGRGIDIAALFPDVPPVIDACLAAGATDRSEPSSTALGRLLEDMVFLEVANRQNFFAVEWRVLPDGFTQAALELFPTHPYRAYLAVGLLDPKTDGKAFWDRLAEVDIVDPDYSHILLINRTWDSPHTERVQGERAYNLRAESCGRCGVRADVLRAVCQAREPESRSRQDVDEDQPRLSGGPDYAHPVGLGQIRAREGSRAGKTLRGSGDRAGRALRDNISSASVPTTRSARSKHI